MPEIHSAAAHAVFAYLLLDDDFTPATIERVERLLGVLEPEQLMHITAVADQVSAVALALSAHRQTPDGIPTEILSRAQREHERAVPVAYRDLRFHTTETAAHGFFPAEPGPAANRVDFDEDPFWTDDTDGEG